MTDSLTLASIFLTCADSGGFSAAARRLGMSRSAVGKSIARLEAGLGVRLIHRTTRAQQLTDDGHIYYERAARAVSELEAARAILESGSREPAGLLRVTAPVVFGRHCVAPLLLRLAAQHQRLKITISLTDRPVRLIEEGYDLAVRVGQAPISSVLKGRRIGRQQMTICAAPSYLERRGIPNHRADLAGHELLGYGRDQSVDCFWTPDRSDPSGQVDARARIHVDDMESLADAATQGLGLASLPCWLVRDRIKAGALVRVLPDLPKQSYDIYALWPQAPFMPIRLRAAIDVLAAEVPSASR
jgi:DNA-binding transcriptional LysR family regulator